MGLLACSGKSLQVRWLDMKWQVEIYVSRVNDKGSWTEQYQAKLNWFRKCSTKKIADCVINFEVLYLFVFIYKQLFQLWKISVNVFNLFFPFLLMWCFKIKECSLWKWDYINSLITDFKNTIDVNIELIFKLKSLLYNYLYILNLFQNPKFLFNVNQELFIMSPF